uniref:Uncharacterized protein n=1 Tax=Crocodylus porosus TaxID=8502 RepID=A0A7M4EXC8_CROPO
MQSALPGLKHEIIVLEDSAPKWRGLLVPALKKKRLCGSINCLECAGHTKCCVPFWFLCSVFVLIC